MKLLWIDDEENILAAARRLLRGEGYELVTTTDPHDAIQKIQTEIFGVIISDQRMPSMTGLELLEKAKALQPEAVRIMVTGFIDHELISSAINNASVFRFITKPWEEYEIKTDIKKAFEKYEEQIKRKEFRRDVSVKTHELTELTRNLNIIIDERTKSLAISQKNLLEHEERISKLSSFIQKCSYSESIEELMDQLRKELKVFRGWSAPLLTIHDTGKTRLYGFSGKGYESKWSTSNEIEGNPQEYLAHVFGRPVGRLLSFPFSSDKWHGSRPPTLHLEKLGESDFDILPFIEERLQPFSLILNRIMIEKKLESAGRQWESTFDSIPDPIAIISEKFEILRANSAFTHYKCPIVDSKNAERSNVVKVGSRQFEVSHYPVSRSRKSEYYVHHYRDITEEQSLYGKVVQNQKMAALGSLAGNISHELNNPITGIRSLIQILLQDDGVPWVVKEELTEIAAAALRSQNIIRDFQDFTSLEQVERIETLSLDDLIRKTIPLLKTSLRHLETNIKTLTGVTRVRINPQMFQQVLFNLIINASQAMEEGGKLYIGTSEEGEFVCVTIADTGSGIPAENLEKIFDPFFTTKPLGRGTGLGLSLCRTIVDKFGGRISVQSSVGVGSEFKVYLPKAVE